MEYHDKVLKCSECSQEFVFTAGEQMFFAGFHVEAVLLDFLDDVFLLHLALETAQCIFQRFTFLNTDFSHLDFTVLPMHVAMIAINHKCYERSTRL